MDDALQKKDAHIYIRANTSDGLFSWYAIKKFEDTRHKSLDELEFLSPVFRDDTEYKMSSTCVALGSVIYVIGGDRRTTFNIFPVIPDPISNEVFYIDTLHPKSGWAKAPPMLMKRTCCYAFTLDCKIYVMGGFMNIYGPYSVPLIYAEVFDPLEKKDRGWQPAFSKIPDRLNHGYVYAVTERRQRQRQRQLLVFSSDDKKLGSLYSYDFDDKLWSLCYGGHFGPQLFGSITFLDDIMYYLDAGLGTMMGFDVKNPHMPPNTVTGLVEEKDFLPHPDFFARLHFLHLGDARLCLLFEQYNKKRQLLVITCLTFTVSVVRNHRSGEVVGLVARHLSKSSCLANAKCICNYLAVPAFGGREPEEDTHCKPINDRNEEGTGNATVDIKKNKKKKKKHANTNRKKN